jgi:hypothetical protein
MRNIEAIAVGVRNTVDTVVSIVRNEPMMPTNDRELMNLGTINALVHDHRTPQRIGETDEGFVQYAVNPSEREIQRGHTESNQIFILPDQEVLLQEAIHVASFRETDEYKT